MAPYNDTKKSPLIAILILGGFSVLFSYYWAYLQPDAQKLWGGITGGYKWIWKVGGVLTAIGFLYIGQFILFSSHFRPDDQLIFQLFLTYLFFYLSAGTWVFVTFGAIRNKTFVFKVLVFLNLLCTAVTSVWIYWLTDLPTHEDLWLKVSGWLLMIQHIVLDLILWSIYFF